MSAMWSMESSVYWSASWNNCMPMPVMNSCMVGRCKADAATSVQSMNADGWRVILVSCPRYGHLPTTVAAICCSSDDFCVDSTFTLLLNVERWCWSSDASWLVVLVADSWNGLLVSKWISAKGFVDSIWISVPSNRLLLPGTVYSSKNGFEYLDFAGDGMVVAAMVVGVVEK